MGLLSAIGKILALIGGIITLVVVIAGLLQFSLGASVPGITEGFGYTIGSDLISLIITILGAVGLIVSFNNKFDIDDEWLEGVLIIIFGLLASSGLGILGGVLVLISGLL